MAIKALMLNRTKLAGILQAEKKRHLGCPRARHQVPPETKSRSGLHECTV